MEQLISADPQQARVPDGTRSPRRLGHIAMHNVWHGDDPDHMILIRPPRHRRRRVSWRL